LRIQSQIIIALIILNACIAAYDGFGVLGLIPEYAYIHPLNQTQLTPEQGMVRYGNASDIAADWSQNPPTVIGVIGDVVGSLPTYFKVLIDIFAGFPMLIIQIASAFALDTVSSAAILVFATLFGTPFGFLMVSYIIELISGRTLNE
jgi:hypothetical protein